jgi:hypothetical protein
LGTGFSGSEDTGVLKFFEDQNFCIPQCTLVADGQAEIKVTDVLQGELLAGLDGLRVEISTGGSFRLGVEDVSTLEFSVKELVEIVEQHLLIQEEQELLCGNSGKVQFVSHGEEEEPTVHVVKQEEAKCYECGETGHLRFECPTVRCFGCGQYGHLQGACLAGKGKGKGKNSDHFREKGGWRSGVDLYLSRDQGKGFGPKGASKGGPAENRAEEKGKSGVRSEVLFGGKASYGRGAGEKGVRKYY